MVVSKEVKYSLEEVLNPEDLQNLESPQRIEQQPDAQVVHWEDMLAVTTPGNSIASSLDRFDAGDMTMPQFRTLRGFYGEFTENNEHVVFVNEELKELLGDQAMAITQGVEEAYPVAVRSPEDALDVVTNYDQNYAGNVEQEFWEEINSRHAVAPVLYNEEGMISDTGMALMGSEEMISGDETMTAEQILQEDVSLREMGGADLQTHEAPESAEAERYVDIMLPPNYNEVDHYEEGSSLVIQIDGQNQLVKGLIPSHEVVDYTENNGVYTIELG